ncbi:GreA/GreB family elongation factor [Flavobacterium hauense]
MNPIPTLSFNDYTTLRELIKNNTNSKIDKEVKQLSRELDRAVVNKTEPIDTVVKIGSNVEIEDIKTGQRLKVNIVLPQNSNIKEGKISVFAPLSIALIGFKINDKVVWEMPAGVKNIKIITVSN